MVADNRISFPLILAIAVIAFSSVGQGAEVRWIPGQSYPHPWSIEPTQPIETEIIQFSGPTRYYMNRCAAERMLGGKPLLVVNRTAKTIELQFKAPPTSGCPDTPSPVSGLEGQFGPLEIGSWRFFCVKPGVTFSLDFKVTAVPPKPVYFVDANATGKNTGLNWDDAFTDLK